MAPSRGGTIESQVEWKAECVPRTVGVERAVVERDGGCLAVVVHNARGVLHRSIAVVVKQGDVDGGIFLYFIILTAILTDG